MVMDSDFDIEKVLEDLSTFQYNGDDDAGDAEGDIDQNDLAEDCAADNFSAIFTSLNDTSPTSSPSSRLPEGCSMRLPSAKSAVWPRVREIIGRTTDKSQIIIDPVILAERKQRLNEISRKWLQDLREEAKQFGFNSFSIDSDSPAIVSFFGYLFLRTAEPDMWVEFVESSCLDEFIYILMAPDFRPEHLLLLSKITRQDFEWGGYMDIFTDVLDQVVAWYLGSATAFGSDSHQRPSGLIGRTLSYFPGGNGDPKFEHERFLRGEKGRGLKPNFRKVATIKPKFVGLHRCWTIALEAQIMTLTTFNVALPGDGKYRTATIAAWVTKFRESVGISTFGEVYDMNKCLPLRQGVPKDPRFVRDGPKKCANPEANCPQTEGPWVLLHKHLPMSVERLCQACRKYRDWCGKFRSQKLIDEYTHRIATEKDGCWWCYRDFPPKGVLDRRRPIRDLDDAYVCKDCYSFWKGDQTLLPIPGVHFHPTSPFSCQAAGCRLEDKTLAQAWFFMNEKLFCLQCWASRMFTPGSRNKVQEIRALNPELRGLDHTDCKGPFSKVRKQWAQYIKVQFGVWTGGKTIESRVSAIRALREGVTHVDVSVRNA